MSQNNYVVANIDEAKTALMKFLSNTGNHGISYAFVTDHEGVITVHERTHQPCYGEMRPYGVTHPDLLPEHQRKVRKPGDLHSPFPEKGNPIMVALMMYQNTQKWAADAKEGLKDYLDFYVSEKSPWYNASQFAEVIYDGDTPRGIFYSDTKFHPTVLIEGWMLLRGKMAAPTFAFWNTLRKSHPDVPAAELLLFWYGYASYDNQTYYATWQEYYLSQFLNTSRFINGDPILDGPTFYERGAYNRPDLHFVFGHEKENIQKKVEAVFPLARQFPVEKIPEALEAFRKALA